MNDQSAILHEFFLLALNLAQMKRQDRVVDLFCQAWNAHDLPMELNYSSEPVTGKDCEPIATHKNAFGFFVLRKQPGPAVDEVMPLARNLFKLLAVILENLQREELLKKERNELEKTVEARVSEIKQGEQALRESEKKFRALYENAPLPYQSLDNDGCFLDVNPAWLRTLGYDRDEVIGHCYADFLHPEWKPHFEKNFPAFKKRGYVSDVQFRIQHKNGQYRDISFEGCIGYHPDGSFRQTYCVFQDITEKKRTEQDLIEKEHFISAVADTSPALIYVYDLETNCNVYSNSGVERLLGYSTEEIQHMGENVLSLLVHPDDFHLVTELHSKIATATDDAVYSIEYRIKHKDGSWRYMHSDERVFSRNKDGSTKQKIGFSIDITAQKQTRQELENYKDTLEEKVDMRTEELRKTVNLMAGREVRMAELKQHISRLRAQLKDAGIRPIENEGGAPE